MPDLASKLAKELAEIRRPGHFSVSGSTELRLPHLEAEGVGPIALPLLPEQADPLIAIAEAAPYGRGPETVVDPAIRRTWQIDAEQIRIEGRLWEAMLDGILERVTAGLGVEGSVAAEFYKLLIYDEGSFFTAHRDTEKAAGMFATLVIVLPSDYAGGTLSVRHGDQEHRFDLQDDEPGMIRFAAFYADCVHEVSPVTRGHRLTLIYNLIRRGPGPQPKAPSHDGVTRRVSALLRDWAADAGEDTPATLVRLLEHAYTPADLQFRNLKGLDGAVAGVLTEAARQADCTLHLALLSIEEYGPAEYHGYSSRPYFDEPDDDDDDYEIIEVDDRSAVLTDWRQVDDAPGPALQLPAAEVTFVPPDALETLVPTTVSFTEATGNAGASFERSYHQAALVLWPRHRLSTVLTRAGLPASLPWIEALAERWATGSEEPAVWNQAHALAEAMLADLPCDIWQSGAWRPDEAGTQGSRFLAALTRLGDATRLTATLTHLAQCKTFHRDNVPAIVAALLQMEDLTALDAILSGTMRKAPWACANLLARMVTALPPQDRPRLKPAATHLVEGLPFDPTERFRLWDDEDEASMDEYWENDDDEDEEPLYDLDYLAPSVDMEKVSNAVRLVADTLTALPAIDEALADQAAAFFIDHVHRYRQDTVLIPTLLLISTENAASPSSAVNSLRDHALLHLRNRIALPLEPPVDWRRDALLSGACDNCLSLRAFLADREKRTWTLKAREADRRHVTDVIQRAQSDLDLSTEKRGRPYTLVCTKNQAGYERRLVQRKDDQEKRDRLEKI